MPQGGFALWGAGLENRSRENVSHETHDACDERPDALAPALRTDADLRAVVKAWSGLDDAVRAGILAMVRASK